MVDGVVDGLLSTSPGNWVSKGLVLMLPSLLAIDVSDLTDSMCSVWRARASVALWSSICLSEVMDETVALDFAPRLSSPPSSLSLAASGRAGDWRGGVSPSLRSFSLMNMSFRMDAVWS